MTYMEAIDELSTLLESAILDYEYSVLAESTELAKVSSDGKASFGDKAKGAVVKVKAIMRKMWEFVKSLAKRAWDFIKKVATKDNANAPMTIAGEPGNKVKIPKAVTEPRAYANAVLKLKSQMMRGSKVVANDDGVDRATVNRVEIPLFNEDDINAVLVFVNDSVDFEPGKPLPKLKDYQDASNVVSKAVEQLDGMPIHDAIGAEGITMISKAATAISKSFSTFVSGVSKLVPMNRANGKQRTNANNMKSEMDKKNENAVYMNKRDGFGNTVFQDTLGESVDVGSISYLAKRAHLLEEAAEIYANMAKMTGETLVEDAHSEPVVEKQKGIKDIPEETPVVAKEYPEDTSGGEGKANDYLEDDKEVVDGDTRAMELLTKDEQSKTITESIDLVFDL